MKTKILLFAFFLLAVAGSARAQLVITPTPAGVVTAPIDSNGWKNFKLTLTQNVTSFSFVGTPPPAQAQVTVIFAENATGGFTVTFASNISNPCSVTTTALAVTTCQFNYDGTTNTWIGISGSSSGSGSGGIGAGATPLAPGNFSLSPYCPVANTFNCYFSPANAQIDTTATWSSVSNIVAITDNKFTAGDVTASPKYIWGFGATVTGSNHGGCEPYQPMPGITQMTTTHLTITGFIDSNHVTVSGNPGTTWSTAGGCIIWGNTDDAGAAALEAAYDLATSCPHITQEAGNYVFVTFHFNSQPNGCANIPALFGSSAPGAGLGNIWFAGGEDLGGRGNGATQWLLPPDFPESGTCNNGFTFLNTSVTYVGACFAVPPEALWHDFTIALSGPTGLPTNTAMLNAGVGSLEHVNCLEAGGNVAGTVGFVMSVQAQGQQLNFSACGATGIYADASTGTNSGSGTILYNYPAAVCFRCSVDNSSSAQANSSNYQIQAGGNLYLHSSHAFGTQDVTGSGIAEVNNHGGTLWLEDFSTTQVNSAEPYTAYQASSGSVLHAIHARLGTVSNTGIPTTVNALQCSAACTNYLFDTFLGSQGAGNTYSDGAAGSKLFDLGGITLGGSATAPSITGSVFGSLSTTGTTLVAANLTPTTNFGTGCATAGQCMSTVTGNSGRGQFTVTYGTGPASPQTLTVTFPTVFFKAPACFLIDVGGTNAFPTSITTTSTSTTTAVFSIVNTPVGGSTDVFQISCSL
jgi:hypothetical protein